MKPHVVAVLAVAACAHTYADQTELPEDVLAADQVSIELRSGRSLEAHAEGRGNALVWRGKDNERVSAAEVRAVERVSIGRGATDGLAVGFGVGAALGVVGGLASGDDPPCQAFLCLLRLSATDKALILGAGLGLVGGLVGAIAGAAAGSTVRYELSASSQGASVKRTWEF